MEDILRTIGNIGRALDSIANIEFKDINLSRGQYLYLVRIKENPGIISDHLAYMLRVDRTTAARSIKKLEKEDLILKKEDQHNKKIRHLYVTEKGKKLAIHIEAENKYSNKMAIAGLNDKEKRELSSLLKKIEENTSKDWNFVKHGGKRKY